MQTAHTTLRTEDEPLSLTKRVFIRGGATAVGCGVGLVVDWAFSVEATFWTIVWPAGAALLGLAVGSSIATFRHVCTYVGDRGVAKLGCSGSRSNVQVIHQMAFAEAAELRIRTTEHQTNNVYQRTDFQFVWTSSSGERRLMIRGSHQSERNDPPRENELHYARAAEKSWTLHLLAQVEPALEKESAVRFNLTGGDHLRVGRGFIEIHQKGETARCDSDEIADLTLVGGTFIIKRTDAKVGWLRRRGVFEFEYSDLANAGLFLICLERLLGFGL